MGSRGHREEPREESWWELLVPFLVGPTCLAGLVFAVGLKVDAPAAELVGFTLGAFAFGLVAGPLIFFVLGSVALAHRQRVETDMLLRRTKTSEE